MNKQITWLLLGLFLASLLAGCATAAVPTTQVVNETVPAVSTAPAVSTMPAVLTVPAVSTAVVPAPTSASASAVAVGPVTLTLYNPLGASEVSQLFAPRVGDLTGKTICELWNGSWEGSRTFPVITELLQKQYPTAKVIDYTKLPPFSETTSVPDLAKVAAAVKAAGCQAVIIGNAG